MRLYNKNRENFIDLCHQLDFNMDAEWIFFFAIFDSYLSYCCLAWAQNFGTIQRIVILQKKAIKNINFQLRNFHTSPLFKQNSILKFQDKICLENILSVNL